MKRTGCRSISLLRWALKGIIPIGLLLGMITVMMFVIPQAGAAFKFVKVGMGVPDLTFQTLGKKSISLTELNGAPASLLIFWATWSSRSRPALEEAQKLAEKYSEKGLKIVTINVESPAMKFQEKQAVSKMKEELGLSLTVALDEGYNAYNSFGVVATPSFAVLNAEGVIVHEAASFRKTTGEEITERVEILLGLREEAVEEKTVEEPAYKPERKALLNYNLGRNLLVQGNREKAMSKLEDSVDADAKFSSPRILLGHLLLDERTPEALEKAEKLFREALETEGENVSALTGLGEILMEKDQTDEAAEVLNKAIGLNDTYTPAIVNLGFVLAKQGKSEEAKARFEEALELNPLDPSTFFRRGESAEITGDLNNAASDYRRAIEILMGVM